MTDETIATYTFLPWVRQGLASEIKTSSTQAGKRRATVEISLELKVDDEVVIENGSSKFVSKNVHLVGPGDVIGISPRAIVRTEPRNWITDFESNYLAFIEFYEEDFPWRFTPTASENSSQETRLLPWIFLMVLEEGEFNDIPPVSGLLPAIQLIIDPGSILPPAAQAWAWAHVHVSRDITRPDDLKTNYEKLMRENRDHAFSRLLSPRKLKPSTGYHAFLIPSFELGRLAGLGQEPTDQTRMLDSSWDKRQTDFPVYYRWYFRTGERGDFEYLVSLLKPREVDQSVGIRDMDMQEPNFGIRGIRAGSATDRVIGLEGALRSPTSVSRPVTWPPKYPDAPETKESYDAFLSDLEKMVNLQEDLQNPATNDPPEMLLNQPDPAAKHPDPIISPPLYGRWHALQHTLKVGEQGWVNELNQDPRLRVPAGFGTKVIQAGQEGYIQRAWQQLGDILRANHKIRQIQVSIAASLQLYQKHVKALDTTDLDQQLRIIALTRQMHSRVIRNGSTVYQELRQSKVEAAVKPAFQRILRMGGPVMRKAFRERPPRASQVLVQLNSGSITAAQPRETPTRPLFLRKLDIADLREDRLTSQLPEVNDRSNFDISLPGLAAPLPTRTATTAANFHTSLQELHARLGTRTPGRPERTVVDAPNIQDTLIAALNPRTTILQRAHSLIHIPVDLPSPHTETIVPIMAHPVFSDPMYKPLRDLSNELLLPNLNLIPNNTVTLMETNPKFIESYMVGLNHEMSRELLWREYPTDQRGSYFRQFWDVGDIVKPDGMDPKEFEESLRDIKPIHEWQPGDPLGENAPETRALPKGRKLNPDDEEPDLVLVIRGDLLKRYPTAIIFAQQAVWAEEQLETVPPITVKVRKLSSGGPIREPVFKAQIEPDLYFLGFKLKEQEAKGNGNSEEDNPGWFFVIQERPGEPRFGMDLQTGNDDLQDRDKLYVWNDLKWEHLNQDGNPIAAINASITPLPAIINRGPENIDEELLEDDHDRDIKIKWGSNAADMAYILFQAPVMVAIHAANMLSA